jgi:hypothetical protein
MPMLYVVSAFAYVAQMSKAPPNKALISFAIIISIFAIIISIQSLKKWVMFSCLLVTMPD